MRAVVVAHGDVLPSDRAVIGAQDYVVAADGGAFALERWKLLPHLIVGDMDSLGDAGVVRDAPSRERRRRRRRDGGPALPAPRRDAPLRTRTRSQQRGRVAARERLARQRNVARLRNTNGRYVT